MAQDAVEFGPAARAIAHEALARAEQGLALPADLEEVRRLTLEIDRT